MAMPEKKEKLNPLPDLGDVIFLMILVLLLWYLPNYLFTDGSLGWHILTGKYILGGHSLPQVDLFSYTQIGKDWVAYEWLCDVIMSVVNTYCGLNGLAVLFASIIAFVFMRLYEDEREAGCNFLLSVFLVVCGAIASSVHWLARPHVFSFLFVYLTSKLCFDYFQNKCKASRLLIFLPIMAVLWANLHPAFIIGIVIAAIYATSTAIMYIAKRNGLAQSLLEAYSGVYLGEKVKTYILAIALMLMASLVNPYGFDLHQYIFHYMQGSAVLMATNEYMPPNLLSGSVQSIAFLIVLIFAFMSFFKAIRTKQIRLLPQGLVCVLFTFMALSSVRHIPLFIIVSLPFIAQLFKQRAIKYQSAQAMSLIGRFRQISVDFDQMEALSKMHIFPMIVCLTLIVSAFCGGKLIGTTILDSKFDSARLPGQCLESIKELELDPKHGIAYDNWGGYLCYQLNIPVFIDDRADFYGQDFYMQYGTISQMKLGYKSILEKYQTNWLLFPNNSLLVHELSNDQNWKRVCTDNAATLFIRSSLAKDKLEEGIQKESERTKLKELKKQLF